MSASPMARQVSEAKSIPTKKVYISHSSDMPSHYSSTPGGTLYSTTPGGTKIVYEKSILMNLRNSPISKTPPNYGIPDSMLKGKAKHNNSSITNNRRCSATNVPSKIDDSHEEQFHIDI